MVGHQTIIFVPGILGTELFLNEDKIWPPSPSEMVTGYRRLSSLMDPKVEAKEPISNVLIVDFYDSLQEDLKSIAKSIEANFIPFGYDWRKSIAESAKDLSDRIRYEVSETNQEIILVAHSMGGLLCRYLLESGEFTKEPWFRQIKRLVGLAVPNIGSPLALVRALGLKGTVSLSGEDIIKLATDQRYPSLYQLMPPPNQSTLWRVKGPNIELLNHFNPEIVRELELSSENIACSEQTWQKLQAANKPKHVQYTFLGGTGHSTVTRVELHRKKPTIIEGRDVGDGTVPLWSSIQSQYQNAVAPGSHRSFFRSSPARDLLFNIFGIFKPQRPFSVGEAKTPAIDLSIQSSTYSPEEEIDLIALPLVPATKIEGVARLERQRQDSQSVEFEPFGNGVEVHYQGPEIALVRLKMRAPQELGAYRIRFEGSHALSEDRKVGFFVTSEVD